MRIAHSLCHEERGADFLIAVKHCHRKGVQLIKDRLRSHGRDIATVR